MRAPRGISIAFECARIAGSIVILLVGVNNFGGFLQERNFLQHLVAVIAVLPHDGNFIGSQLARLAQDGIGDGHLSDVVEKRAARNDIDLFFRAVPWRGQWRWCMR